MAVCRPPACPPDLFSIQRKIVTEHDPNQIVFCDNLEILYTMTASGFTFAVMTQLPGFHHPELKCIPIPSFPPLSFGVAYSSGKHSNSFPKISASSLGNAGKQITGSSPNRRFVLLRSVHLIHKEPHRIVGKSGAAFRRLIML